MIADFNDRAALMAHVGFRFRAAVGGTLGVVALLATTFRTWFRVTLWALYVMVLARQDSRAKPAT